MAKREERKQRSSPAARRKRANTDASTQTRPLAAGEQQMPSTRSAQPPAAAAAIRRRQFLVGSAGLAASAAAVGGWLWATYSRQMGSVVPASTQGDQLVVHWNEATLAVIRALRPPLPVAARALAIVHTCMFDAWAAYQPTASGTRQGSLLRRPADERTIANTRQAISYAAYRALVDLFPGEEAFFRQFLRSPGYDPAAQASGHRAQSVGEQAARMVLVARHQDGANQLGDLYPGAYADYTRYQPVNTPEVAKNVKLWQPLRVPDAQNNFQVQQFDCPQWGNVTPFALSSAVQLVPRPGPEGYSNQVYAQEARQILEYSANLSDRHRAIAEYWSNGPAGEQAAGHWCLFAQYLSRRDNHTLDQNITLFFILANALLDTSIVCWATKRAYNAAYPLTVIHALFRDKQIRAWAGPGKEVQWIDGRYWLPYRPAALIAPPFPQYCSEQSAFAAAAARVLRRFSGSDRLDMSYTFPAHTSQIDPGTPDTDITLSWHTFSQAADQAGLAGRYSGTHFTQSDLDGRTLGNQVGALVWEKAQKYLTGSA